MAVTNRVVWSDGLFIKPQHFQQQQRYLEHQINERALAVSDYLYGFSIGPALMSHVLGGGA